MDQFHQMKDIYQVKDLHLLINFQELFQTHLRILENIWSIRDKWAKGNWTQDKWAKDKWEISHLKTKASNWEEFLHHITEKVDEI